MYTYFFLRTAGNVGFSSKAFIFCLSLTDYFYKRKIMPRILTGQTNLKQFLCSLMC
jgi:hypothetical protein